MLKRKSNISNDRNKDQKYKELLQSCPFLDNQDMESGTLFIKVSCKLMMIKLKDINLIEGVDDYIRIYLQPRPVLVLITMKAFADILPPKEFVRIHRSYIVPVSKILSIDKGKVTIPGKEIRIGSSYFNAYKQLSAMQTLNFEV